MKNTFKRVLAGLLVAVMLLGTAPLESLTGIDFGGLFGVEAEATMTTENVLSILNTIHTDYPNKSYFSKNRKRCEHGSTKADFPNGKMCYNCRLREVLESKGIPISGYNYNCRTCFAFSSYCFTKCFGKSFTDNNYYMVADIWKVKEKSKADMKKFFDQAKVGDIIRFSKLNDKNKAYNCHWGVFISCDKNGYTIFENNVGGETYYDNKVYIGGYTGTVKWQYKDYSTLDASKIYNIDILRANNYEPAVKITVSSPTNVTNTSATINSSFSRSVEVKKLSYMISTNKNDISANGTLDETRKNEKSNYKKVYDYSNSPKTLNKFSTNVSKVGTNKLSPNTTYYYRILVKTKNNSWYQSPVASFKTNGAAPVAPVLTISGEYADIGIKDTAAVSWNAVSGADSYCLKLYNPAGIEVHSRDDVKGITYAFPAECFSTAGEYSVAISAKNAVDTTDGAERATITVHDNVDVVFYDTVSNKTITTVSVGYGHAAEAPVNPKQKGYTFIKWDKAFEKVTEPITVNTVYEANEYTVKFIDSLTGSIINTQKVKFNEAATAPVVKAPSGYTFVGWNTDFAAIDGDTTVYTVYNW